MLKVDYSSAFKRDYKNAKKRGLDMNLLDSVILTIANQIPLNKLYKDHALKGEWSDFRECHISFDWLLVYKYTDDGVIFARTGTHQDIFGC